MFSNFIFGGQILSKMLSAMGEQWIKKVFKVEPEVPSILPFTPYSAAERMFFIWTLISNFHDTGIAIQYADKLIDRLNNIFAPFGFKIEHSLHEDTSVSLRAGEYFALMATFYPNGICPQEGAYGKSETPDPYVVRALFDAYKEHDQGIVSALGLFKNIEESFFVQREDRLNLENTTKYRVYYDTVVRHDIARAALAIAVHNLDPPRYQKLFPIDFGKFPITFVFLLVDELQEFLRPEGITYEKITKLKRWPDLSISPNLGAPDSHVTLSLGFNYHPVDAEEAKEILGQAGQYYAQQGKRRPYFDKLDEQTPEQLGGNLADYFKDYWRERHQRISEKLRFPSDGPIHVVVEVSIPAGPIQTRERYVLSPACRFCPTPVE